MFKILLFSLWLAFHPVHVSLLSIDYAPDEQMFNMFLRIYYDDFLLDSGIKSEDQKNLDFMSSNSFTREVIVKYVDEKIRIYLNDKPVTIEIANMNLSDNELRINLFFRSKQRTSRITVKNFIMTTIYSDQANLLILKVNGFEQGVKLTANETERTFRIN